MSTASRRHPNLRARLRQTRRFISALIDAWIDHHCSSHGAAVAFYALLSLAPVVVLVLVITGWFADQHAAASALIEQVRALAGEHGAKVVQEVVQAARLPDSGIWPTVVAAAILAVGATTIFAELKDSLDEIWEVKPPLKHRGATGALFLIRKRLLSFGLILVLAFLLLVSLIVNAGLQAVQGYWSPLFEAFGGDVILVLSAAFSFAVVTVLFAAILKLLPEVHLRWRQVWAGALITATLFTIGKQLIGIYLGHAPITSYFGAAGSLIVLLLWVYFSTQIFFVGAELTRLYAQGLPGSREAGDWPLVAREQSGKRNTKAATEKN